MKNVWYVSLLLFASNLVADPLCLVYHPCYNFTLGTLADKAVQLVHPIDGSRYKKIWDVLAAHVDQSQVYHVSPDDPSSDEQLCAVHTVDYIQSLTSSKTLSHIIDLDNLLSWMPAQTMYDTIIMPQRWAVAGTVLAVHHAMATGMANQSWGWFSPRKS